MSKEIYIKRDGSGEWKITDESKAGVSMEYSWQGLINCLSEYLGVDKEEGEYVDRLVVTEDGIRFILGRHK